MSLIIFDGFDSYANGNTDISQRWDILNVDPNDLTFVTGRFGFGKSLRSNDDYRSINITTLNNNEIIFGFAFKLDEAATKWNGAIFETYASGEKAVSCEWNSDGTIEWYRSSTSIATANIIPLIKGAWYFLEFKIKLTNSTISGDCVLRINNEQVFDMIGVDTLGTNSNITDLRIGPGATKAPDNAWQVRYIDDLYISNTSGSAPNNTFLGDIRVVTIRPTGNGTTNNFLGSDADSTDNYLHVDEETPDGDTSYVESSTSGEIDMYLMNNLPVTPVNIFGLENILICKKDDAGTRTGKHVLRLGGTNYPTGEFFPSADSYIAFTNLWEKNPDTDSQWLKTDIDNLEAGIKVES